MTQIKTISVLLPYKLGSVNCYLIENDSGYVLIDTGSSNKRAELERELENTGCKPGDLLENRDKPSLNSIMDDLAAANASVKKLKRFEINTVYPGHGKPFLMEQFIKAN